MDILNYLYEHTKEILDDIFALVKIPSVACKGEDGKPYGDNCAKALDTVMAIARREGMAVKNFDYYAATVTYGKTPEKLGILTHVDVVPEGDGWVFNPFFLTESEGKIYGRGVADDKGAAIMSIWALKAIKELGIELSHGVRLVFGSGEEVGCKDLEYYMSKQEMPPYVFSPDASFPIINTEKGRYCGEFDALYDPYFDGPQIIRFNGGSTVNVVAQSSRATVRGVSEETLEKALKKAKRLFDLKYSYTVHGSDIDIEFEGKPAHASCPEKGINAITAMLELISFLPLKGELFKILKSLKDMFGHGDYYGKGISAEMSDEISGNSTYSIDILNCENGCVSGAFDARLSLNATYENTVDPIYTKMKNAGIRLKKNEIVPAHHVDAESDFIKILSKAYEKYTSHKSECMSMGGITYVHNIPNAVAFGPLMPEHDARIHSANECINIEDIIKATAIFAQAIIDICS